MRELLNRTVAWKAVNGTDGLVEIPTLFDGEYEVLDDRLKDCLVGKPLGMIGMSLIRYQYLSLVNFLEHETWIPWDGGAHLGSASPVVENQWRKPTESDKEHWNRFFQGTNRDPEWKRSLRLLQKLVVHRAGHTRRMVYHRK